MKMRFLTTNKENDKFQEKVMEIIKIEEGDLICSCSPKLAKIIDPYLSYTAVWYKEGLHHKVRKEYIKSTMWKSKNTWYFYSGFLNRILKLLRDQDVTVKVSGTFERVHSTYLPSLKEITFRPDQIDLINDFLNQPRGVLTAVTGMGKTVIGMGILSTYPKKHALWLCHTKDLMNQTYKELKEKGFKSVGRIGGGYKETDKLITVATRQSFIKIAEELGHLYDIVVVDEVHHLSGVSGEYAKILSQILAPVRLGLTATMPEKAEGKLAIEGLIGPVVGTLTVQEGNALGIVAKPKIKIIKIPISRKVQQLRQYKDVYSEGVVNRVDRNEIIAKAIRAEVKKGNSVLVIVSQIDHGENILSELPLSVNAEFIHGLTDSDTRDQMKNALEKKKMDCVICTTIWKEGISIRSLNCIVNAAGGKSEISTLQAIGRGLRTAEGKKEVTIIDFFDESHRYLISHFGNRISLYCDMDWI